MKKATLLTICLLLIVSSLIGCGKETYQIRFVSDDAVIETIEVQDGDLIEDYPLAPPKSGFDFVGWYANGEAWDLNFNTVSSNLTLTAKWKLDLYDMFSNYSSLIGATLASDGSYLELDTNPYDFDDFSMASILSRIEEANTKLGFSDALYRKMINTSALQGRQHDENDIVTVEWTYHPDNGLEVIYTAK